MKVFVQQPSTGLFYGGQQLWVRDSNRAMAFPGTLQAFDFCTCHTMCEAQIVLFSADPSDLVFIKLTRNAHAAV